MRYIDLPVETVETREAVHAVAPYVTTIAVMLQGEAVRQVGVTSSMANCASSVCHDTTLLHASRMPTLIMLVGSEQAWTTRAAWKTLETTSAR